jgi:hypothetical protein
MKFQDIFVASKLVILLGALLVLLSFLMSMFATFGPNSSLLFVSIFQVLSFAYSLFLFPAFFFLYFWAGYRAVKDYGLDFIGAGFVAMFSYLVVSVLDLFLKIISIYSSIGTIAVGRALGSAYLSGPVAAGVLGMIGGAVSLTCFAGILLIGMLINFGVGALGGWFAKR